MNRYWVGGTGNWSDNTNHWSDTSGGAPGASLPSATDDVFFDSASHGSGYTVTIDAPATCQDLNFAAPATGVLTTAGNSAMTVSGSIVMSSTMVHGWNGNITMNATSGTKTITSNGITFSNFLTINGAGGTFNLADDFTNYDVGNSLGFIRVTAGTFNANGFNVSVVGFLSDNANVRTVTMGSGTWTLTGHATTIWDMTNVTNLTFNNGNVISCLPSVSDATTITIDISTALGASAPAFDILNSHASSEIQIIGASTGIDMTGCVGIFRNSARTIYGNLIISAGQTLNAGASVTTFAKTTGTMELTTNGKTLDFPVTLSAVGGTLQLQDSLTVGTTRTLTVSNGVFDANNFNVTTGAFHSNGSTVRTVTMGSGLWTITGVSSIVWWTSTTTNLTFNKGNPILYSPSSNVAGARAITSGSGLGNNSPDFDITGGNLTNIQIGNSCGTLDFTGFSGTLSDISANIYGSLTLDPAMTITPSGSEMYFSKTTGTMQLTTNGVSIPIDVALLATGGTLDLMDDLTLSSSTGLLLWGGTFNSNNFDITADDIQIYAVSPSITVNMGSGTWTVQGATSYAWYTEAAGVTLNSQTSTIKFTNATATARTFSGGGKTYYNVWMDCGASTAILTVVDSNTFNEFKDTGTAAHTIKFTAGTTQTFANFDVSGSLGNLITIDSTNTNTHSLVKSGGGTVSCDYLSIQHSVATPALTWYAGNNSIDNQAVATAGSGWIFSSSTSIKTWNTTPEATIKTWGTVTAANKKTWNEIS